MRLPALLCLIALNFISLLCRSCHCVPCTDGQLRLVGGNIDNEGRLEICLNNEWGTICDDNWSTNDANVACGALGFSNTDALAFSSAHFGAGSGDILLDNVACTGSESSLLDCSHDTSVYCSSDHSEDAGVRCHVITIGTTCTYGDVRLVDGSTQYEGRVEVCIDDQWGTVCDNSWDSDDATVVCRQLGFAYTGNGIAYSNAPYGSGSGPIFLTDVSCTSSKTSLLQCISGPILSGGCSHSEDAGVKCEAPCNDGQLRLAGSNVDNEGRVEICLNNEWGTICDDNWSIKDANVACRVLGFSGTATLALNNAHFGAGSGDIFLDNVGCTGSESSLLDCSHDTSVSCYNGHNEDAGVRCHVSNNGTLCDYGDVRLVGGTTQYEGRVEVCIDDQWGTVCHNSWDSNDATVVCKQLGYAYTGSGTANSNAYFGVGSGPIYLTDVSCTSNETSLLQCISNPILSYGCSHLGDAGVKCEAPCTDGELRLAGGNVDNEGRVEICLSNEWGRICDDNWSTNDADVVCGALGFSSTDALAFGAAHFVVGIGRIFLDNVGCTGSESSLLDCTPDTSVSCLSDNEDAGVRCHVDATGSTCDYGDVRLVGGSTRYEGRVDVCIDNQWGTVCHNSWDSDDATVVCKQLGYAYTGSGIAYSNAYYGAGSGPIYLTDVSCTSSQTSLLQCNSDPILSGGCTHLEDAGVKCEAPCNDGQLRLAGGNVDNEGRVEICLNNEWGTICDDNWSTNDANVVCGALGFSSTDALAFGSAHFGAGIGVIVLDNVHCTGSESSLVECSHDTSISCSAGHSEDAGVRCNVTGNSTICDYGDIRLVGGSTQYEGRVEVCIDDQWGTLCDNSWDKFDATVVCSQLGYTLTGTGTAYSNAQYGAGSGPIYLTKVSCTGTETSLLQCNSDPILSSGCSHAEDAGVKCEAPCTDGQLRLAGGNVVNEGRVEICLNNEWGTICDDNWSIEDAKVACSILGFSNTDALAFGSAHFGEGSGDIFLDNVACTGSESSLLDCSHDTSVNCQYGHSEDAGVRCHVNETGSTCDYGDVRLMDGSTQYEGRVEVCVDDQWGTVCDNSWDSNDATVVCEQLGYAYTESGIAYSNAPYGAGSGPNYLTDVLCTGSETNLLQCYSDPILSSGCTHLEDAGVKCEAPCTDGQLRLAGGNVDNEGRVEICLNNEWGTICDDNWSTNDANVVCGALSFSNTDALAFGSAHFGAGSGDIFLDNVGCTGSESSLLDCSHDTSVSCSSGHNEDAGVRCHVVTNGSTCDYGDIRLVGGSTPYEGRVEVCIDNQWGTVCDNSWDSDDATVVCKQLGYSYTGIASPYSNAQYGVGSGPIYLTEVSCTSSRISLLQCNSDPILSGSCTHSEDAGVKCEAPCTDGQLRLVGGNVDNEGRVEICLNNEWGTICDDNWHTNNANVACGVLGFSSTDALAFGSAHFGEGSGDIFVDNVACTGSEPSLLDCSHDTSVNCQYGHSEDAGVRCHVSTNGTICDYGDVRLVGGSTQYEGRVEVCIDDQWGTVCDDNWDNIDATVVCKQLGYTYSESDIAYSSAYYGSGSGPIFLTDVSCTSSKTSLLQCNSDAILSGGCSHSEDAGVKCEAPCVDEELRLVGGNVDNEGRVEICLNNKWGTICDDNWDTSDANVACSGLGFASTDALSLGNAHFGAGSGDILLDNVGCTGSESSLLDCTHDANVICASGHSEDAGVRCHVRTNGSTTCNYGDVRLVGSSTQYEGRVEVCIDDQWGTVCDNSWDSTDATVVCEQMGYAYTGNGIAYSNAQYGAGSGPIYLSEVACTSSKTSLLQCNSDPILSSGCSHSEDAGVKCEAPCTNGELRLVGGYVLNEGRVEICLNNEWGTICDDGWSTNDANVACGVLGFSSTDALAFGSAHFGEGSGDILLDNVGCTGSEFSLLDCSHDTGVGCSSGHNEDAGVRCHVSTNGSTCDYGDVHLVGGSTPYEGRVEVCIDDQWGTVCDNSWDNTDATVVCKQLGYTEVGAAYSDAYYGAGSGLIYLTDVSCTSTETRLLQCNSDPILSGGCSHSEDAGVKCEAPCTNGQLRLVGGNFGNEGRVEICLNNEWGTICDDNWDDNDANVVCGVLGFANTDAVAFALAHFGAGSGDIFLDNVGCTGSESSLLDCSLATSVSCLSGHNEDAGVRCHVITNGSTCNYGDVRLVGGSTQYEGRVEVCIANYWGTVCDNSWDNTDATVVCEQLGYAYTGSGIAYSNAQYGAGSGPIYLTDVLCTSSQTSLLQCNSEAILSGSCTHSEDAGVKCEAPCTQGQLRLVGGYVDNEGRVEICLNNEWGTICDDNWGTTDANVACRELGFSGSDALAFGTAHFGAGRGDIFLDNVGCTGSESSLLECSHDISVSCASDHSEDAGVRCHVTTNSTICDYGDIQLMGGSTQYEGRVEVCIDDQWGTVSDNNWDNTDATVVCNQLAFNRSGTAYSNAYYGSGSGLIYLTDVSCTSSKTSLLQCNSDPILSGGCSHSEDAGVKCEAPCTDGQLRLAGSNVDNEGRVEICLDNKWGTICDDGWSTIDANVACKQLGFTGSDALAFGRAHFGAGSGDILLDNVGCTGSESSLLECSHDTSVSCPSGHSEDAGVSCHVESSESNCTYGDVRLVGGSTLYEGRVEVCIDNQWGTVCDNLWDSTDATVVCRQLGYAYTGSGMAFANARYGAGSGPIYLTNVLCTSSMSSLLQCSYSDPVSSSCTHFEDAGAKCEAPCTDGQLRLAGSNVPNEGRVEICMDNEWGTICDDNWNTNDANVACGLLGFSSTNALAFGTAHFGAGSGDIFLDNVGCTGSESSLLDCNPDTSVSCFYGHSEDAGVRCHVSTNGITCDYGDVRLVGGSTQYEGRVEVCIEDQWGTVCDNSWDNTDATVVCKQLGYAYTGSGTAYSNAHYGSGSGPIYLTDVSCTSSKTSLLQCNSDPILSGSCTHSEDAGVKCEAPCTNGQLRLVGGYVLNEGRVEICLNNEWGTICDDNWDTSDANVACGLLGFSITDALAFGRAHFGAGSGATFLDSVGCTGSESSLLDCSYIPCYRGHTEDAGVRCHVDTNGTICDYGDVRLVGGSTQYEGRVEVCIDNQWGTVCDNSWGSTDATVVCEQLGYAYTGSGTAYSNAQYGSGSGPIYLTDVSCTSSQTSLLQCNSDPILSVRCSHSEDAGVKCEAPCADGQLRLVGGNVDNEGKVEICLNNEWGTICDDGWSTNDANVACAVLGFSSTDALAFGSFHFGAGSGDIFLDEVACTGSESSLLDCSHDTSVSCFRGYTAGVRCHVTTNGTICDYGDVRLVGGSTQYEGRVEVCIDNQWGTVCDNSWDNTDATVVCEQLGYAYTGSGIAYSNIQYGSGSGPIYLIDVLCTGSETSLLQCNSDPIHSSGCTHSEDAGVKCEAPCTDGRLRLAGGNVDNEGRVEICLNNEWGTICDDNWSTNDANVACRQLGFPHSDALAFGSAHFGAGIGDIFLDEVGCTGSESSLLDCSRATSVYCRFGHNEDAGVRCHVPTNGSTCDYGDARLVGGSTQYEGRVEVCIDDQWGTVCDNNWDSDDATVVCRQLGYAYTGSGIVYQSASAGSGPIYLTDVLCTSSETSLLQCKSDQILPGGCSHSEDAGVRCEAPCADGQLRLAGGNVDNEGRVEICLNNEWGTICHNSWDTNDANVACSVLGFSSADALVFGSAHFGQGSGDIFLSSVGCTGSETSLLDCNHATSLPYYCGHDDDAGVRCHVSTPGGTCNNGDIRLVGGSTPCEGRVEVCIDDQWGTVCDNSWDNTDATVVCKQLDCAYTGSGIAYSNAQYGAGSGPIYLNDVSCTNTKTSLLQCNSDPILSGGCSHSEDAGVKCEDPCADGQLRLVGGNVDNEGRVEICLNKEWGTICDDNWGTTDANVACRILGFSNADALAFGVSRFGAGSASVFIDSIGCTGSESSLLDCSHTTSVSCYLSYNAGVRCHVITPGTICDYGDVRLVGGSFQYEGRVEVCIADQWGTVCDNSWDSNDATVVCKQLGYAYTGSGIAYSHAHYSSGNDPIYLTDVSCTSSETSLLQCNSEPILSSGCTHTEDAGVKCEAPCTDGELRLVGGNVENEGRVEICLNNEWGTICDDNWSTNDANVACNILGFSSTNSLAFGTAHFGAGIGDIFLDGVGCTGSESSLLDCFRVTNVYCRYGHNEDAGVRCHEVCSTSGAHEVYSMDIFIVWEDPMTGSPYSLDWNGVDWTFNWNSMIMPGITCDYGDVRLVGGSTQYEGRVEVCIDDQWGTVCDDSWDNTDATVVCKQLGYAYTGTAIAYSTARYGAGSGPIYLTDVSCTSSQTSLLQCKSDPILSSGCSHAEDAGVKCEAPCTDGLLRLAGNVPNEGRVEICMDGDWGTICDDNWGTTDANVACGTLGFSNTNSLAFGSAHFGAGIGDIFLDEVGCTGSESSLLDCSRATNMFCRYGHNEDAGVRCHVITSGITCDYGDIRLVGGSTPYEGRVEVCIENQWGTVCDNSWDSDDATVVCKQLGYSYTGTAIAYSSARYGAGSGPIYLTDVSCTSSKTSLLQCNSDPILSVRCSHAEDAGVKCEAPCTDGQLRLAGNVDNEGRVEICLNNEWGTICDDNWHTNDANVACSVLGFSSTDSLAFGSAHFGAGIGDIFLDEVGCTGSESSLLDCSRATSVYCRYGHNEDAGVRCHVITSGITCDYGDIRLVGGSTPYEGRVEVCIENQWGTVCDNSWDSDDATVVCRQLRYPYTGNGIAYSSARYGAGSGPIYLTEVLCTSTETSLLRCKSDPILSGNCSHAEDAGVKCEAPCTDGQLRLAGNVANEGRVEICLNNEWGTICDDNWSTNDANVACSSLGFSNTNSQAFGGTKFDRGSGVIFLDEVGCTGSESFLLDCSRAASVSCYRSYIAGVRCHVTMPGITCDYGDVRLVGGSTQYEGRVEVCIDDQWGTVCDNSWGSTDVTVVCKQLGYAYTGTAIAYSNALFGAGSGPIYLTDVSCSGSETSLLQCNSDPILSSGCTHLEDAGVKCEAPCTNGQLRLVGGNVGNEGRVEICLNNEWGTICDDNWSTNDAEVACSVLGFGYTDALAFGSAHFGPGSGDIFLDNVDCTGSESSLLDCPHSTSVYCFRGHSEDAGVRCHDPCDPDPCVNGECVQDSVDYSCTCTMDYTGVNCETLIPSCVLGPCKNGGSCTAVSQEEYVCHCGPGYTGENCTEEIDPCVGVECGSGTCVSNGANIYCVCPPGFTGGMCGDIIDPCDPDPCVNGECVQDSVDYSCTCTMDYTGVNCETLIPSCVLGPCKNGGSCTAVSQEEYVCHCGPGYTGENCTEEIDPCVGVECGSGTCVSNGANVYCMCSPGFTGETCGEIIDPCDPDPCVNGECVQDSVDYSCTCTMDYTGVNCETLIPSCVLGPCKNGGSCTAVSQEEYVCHCGPGYTGENCTEEIDPCVGVECGSGTCVSNGANVYCMCSPGFTGETCGEIIDPCDPDPCVNGECVQDSVDYSCTCTMDYTGVNCETLIPSCVLGPCKNGGSCTAVSQEEYVCHCGPGYTGENCTMEIDPCVGVECGSGTCVSNGANVYCMCSPGFTGETCGDIIDIPQCPEERNLPLYPGSSFTYSWNLTEAGSTVSQECLVECRDLIKYPEGATVTRQCVQVETAVAEWTTVDFSGCSLSRSALDLCAAENLMDTNVEAAAEMVVDITTDTLELDVLAVSVAGNFVAKLTDSAVEHEEVRASYLDIIDNLIEVEPEVILESQVESNTSTKILDSLERFTDAVPIPDNATQREVTFTRDNFAIIVQELDVNSFNGEAFSANLGPPDDAVANPYEIDPHNLVTDRDAILDATVSVEVPPSLFGDSPSNDSQRLSYSIFLMNSLFVTSDVDCDAEFAIGSVIVSVRTNATAVNLTEVLLLNFQQLEQVCNDLTAAETDVMCANYDSAGRWTSDNCKKVRNADGTTSCECSQLGHFGLLFDLNPGESLSPMSLAVITYVGAILSTICLITLIITYLCSKKLRASEHGQLLINLSISLIGLYIIFLIAGHVTTVSGLCGFISALLQYFVLVFFGWMAAEAIHLYQKLVNMLGSQIHYFVLKASLVVWLYPLIVVAVSVAVGHNYYVNPFFCRPTEYPFWLGLILPFIIIYIFDWVIFGTIMVSLVKMSRRSSQISAKGRATVVEARRLVIIAFGLSVVFGLGWGLGLAATSSDAKEVTFVFQVIFSIFVGSQGILIFILHGLRSPDARRVWKTWLSCLRFVKTGRRYNFANFSIKHDESSTLKSTPTSDYRLSNLKRDSQSSTEVPKSTPFSAIPETPIQEVEEGRVDRLEDGPNREATAGTTESNSNINSTNKHGDNSTFKAAPTSDYGLSTLKQDVEESRGEKVDLGNKYNSFNSTNKYGDNTTLNDSQNVPESTPFANTPNADLDVTLGDKDSPNCDPNGSDDCTVIENTAASTDEPADSQATQECPSVIEGPAKEEVPDKREEVSKGGSSGKEHPNKMEGHKETLGIPDKSSEMKHEEKRESEETTL